MPFYKRDNDELLCAPTFVYGPGVELTLENKDDHAYPVEGWVWADTLDEAMSNPLLRQQVQSVTMRQARRALNQVGLLAMVEAAIDSLPEPSRTDARIEWEYAAAVERHAGLVAGLIPVLGLSESEVDALFVLAATL